MVIDTSAVAAILLNEPERDRFLARIQADPRRLVSSGSLLEMQMVLARSKDAAGVLGLFRYLDSIHAEIVPFDIVQAELAGRAFLKFGKGRHKACLNFGDCMAYALAMQTSEPLLFKGNDFSQTDVMKA